MTKPPVQQNKPYNRRAVRPDSTAVVTGADHTSLDLINHQVKLLEEAIREILDLAEVPMTEQMLIQALAHPPYNLINASGLRAHLGLFQIHFLVFHSLYRLRRLDPRLLIHTLHIAYASSPTREKRDAEAQEPGKEYRSNLRSGGHGMSEEDCRQHMRDSAGVLSAYYLDLNNLFSTSSQDVKNLLDGFWSAFSRYSTRTVQQTGATSPDS